MDESSRERTPQAREQRCWNHKILDVLDRVPKKRQAQAKIMLGRIAYAEARKEYEQLKKKFVAWCKEHRCADAARILERDWERMVTFFDFPKEHWQHIGTTNRVALHYTPSPHRCREAVQEGRQRDCGHFENVARRRKEGPPVAAETAFTHLLTEARFDFGKRRFMAAETAVHHRS